MRDSKNRTAWDGAGKEVESRNRVRKVLYLSHRGEDRGHGGGEEGGEDGTHLMLFIGMSSDYTSLYLLGLMPGPKMPSVCHALISPQPN